MTETTTASPRPSCNVLVVDDDERFRETLAEMVKSHGHNAQAVATSVEALSRLATHRFDLCLADWRLNHAVPSGDFHLLKSIVARHPAVRVLMISGWKPSPDVVTEALRLGAVAFLGKPIHIEALGRALTHAMSQPSPLDALASQVKADLRKERGLLAGQIPELVDAVARHIEENCGYSMGRLDIGRAVLRAGAIHGRAERQ